MACTLAPMRSRWAVVLLVAVSTAGCSFESAVERPSLGVDNGTTLPVTVTVNGVEIETVQPRTTRTIEPADLPVMPWNVQGRSPSGRVLVTLVVDAGSVGQTTDANGQTTMHGAGDRVDLSCGRLDLYAGPPMLGPMPGPGTPGDCEP